MSGFKIYGRREGGDGSELLALQSVSHCFKSQEDIRRFADFVARCAEDAEAERQWDHVHYRDPDGDREVIVAILDPGNY